MKNINVFIGENIAAVSKKVSAAPEIPEKKLNNAAKSFKCEDSISSIIAIFDNTVFGSGKDGLVFTGEKIIYRPSFSEPIELRFNDFESVEYIKNVTKTDKGKEKVEEYVEISLKDSESVKISDLSDCDYQKLANILKEAFSGFDKFNEEDQILTLEEMSESLKVAYVKVTINMAFDDDGEVDKKEFAEILLLMTRLNLSPGSRFELRSYIASESKLESLEHLLETIDKECVASHNKSIKISLVKDLISIFMSVNEGSYKKFNFLTENQTLFSVSDEEIELAVMAIKNDFNMLREDFTDDALKKSVKELTAKASAVGVPIAAVYLSGSVVGMSAAGMTSGLATLGLGGVLGFSSMATGLGVAVLLGVGAYKGIRHFSGANERDKTKRRELMLNEVIKQTQATISLIIDDLNYITSKLNNALNNHSDQDIKIKKLMSMMSAMTGAASVLGNKSKTTQNNAIKLRCPTILDEPKLKSLTSEPVKKQFYTIIMEYYEERIIQVEKNDEVQEVVQLKIKENISTKELEKLASIFDEIGYFKVADVLKGAAGDVANKAKNKLSGFFS